MKNNFYLFGEEVVDATYNVEDDVYGVDTRITSCNAGGSFIKTKSGSMNPSKESSISMPMSFRYTGSPMHSTSAFKYKEVTDK